MDSEEHHEREEVDIEAFIRKSVGEARQGEVRQGESSLKGGRSSVASDLGVPATRTPSRVNPSGSIQGRVCGG